MTFLHIWVCFPIEDVLLANNIESFMFSWPRSGLHVRITITTQMPPSHYSKWSFSLGFVDFFK